MYSQQKQGFTLIELLVVMAIIGILAAALIPNMLSARNKANDGAAQAFLRHCISAMEMSRDQQGYVEPITKCDDNLLGMAKLNLPSSVTSTTVTVHADRADYSILVTSITGKRFKYDNNTFSEAP